MFHSALTKLEKTWTALPVGATYKQCAFSEFNRLSPQKFAWGTQNATDNGACHEDQECMLLHAIHSHLHIDFYA